MFRRSRKTAQLGGGLLNRLGHILAFVLSAAACELRAQREGLVTIQGTVLDSTRRGIADVRVMVAGTNLRSTSSSNGHFRTAVAPGLYLLEFRKIGYLPLDTPIAVTAGDADGVRVVLHIASAVSELPAVNVRASAENRPEFEARRAIGLGRFIDRGMLDSAHASLLSDVLRRYASRVKFVRHCQGGLALASTGGVASPAFRDPPGDSFCKMPRECYVQVFLNGARIYSMSIPGLPPRIDQFSTTSLEGIEFYRGGAEVPSQYGGTGAACGTLLLWSRR